MADVFISYASPDREIVAGLAEALEASGLSVWWDRELSPGQDFGAEIDRELNSAHCIVTAWSKNAAASQWVRDEATEAKNRGVLFPISIDGAQPPLGFRQIQTMSVKAPGGERDHPDVEAFCAAITQIVEDARRLRARGRGGAPRLPPSQLPRPGREPAAMAARRFLPGKLVSRIAAALSMGLVALGSTSAIDRLLKRWLELDLAAKPWLRFGLIGLPLLAAAAQLLLEWHSERNRRARQRLAVRPGAEQSGYFRIGPYTSTEEDQAGFDRADRAHEGVLSWLETARGTPLYLTGDSGSGKSSLLNAAVLPALRQRGWTVIELRPGQDPEAALRTAAATPTGARRQRQGEPAALRNLLEAAARRAGERLLLVLDQFEEFIILGEDEKKQAFAALIADLRAKPITKLSLLLVLRSDYQSFLQEIGLPPLRQGENLYQVNRFTFAAATNFLGRSGLRLRAAAIDKLLASAAELDETPGLVRPITLNVIGYVLANGTAAAPSLDAGQLVRRYIEQTVRQPVIRDFAPLVLEQLVTEEATKRPRSEEELASATKLGRGDVRAVLNGLGAAALARPLTRTLDPAQTAAEVWELSHDFVARAVARYLGRRRHDVWRRAAFYMSPALLATALAIVAGVVAWNSISGYRTQSQLAKLGLSVVSIAHGLSVVADPSRLTDAGFARAGGLLDQLGELKVIDLNGAKIDSLVPIKGLAGLQMLNLASTAVKDLQPLQGLVALRRLDLSDTKVEDLEPVAGLKALETLVLVDTPVTSLAPIRGLAQLQTLALGGAAVRDLEPLDHLTRLRVVLLSGTTVENIAPLAGLSALRQLDLSGTKVVDFAALGSLASLRVLDLSQTQIETLAPLAGLTGLQQLDLGDTKVVDLAPLGALTALQSLNLNNTNVTDLGPLRHLQALQSLILAGTAVQALDPLAGLRALQILNLNGTKIANLGPLDDLPSLWLLYLSPTVAQSEQVRFNRARRDKHLQAVEIRY
jgi:Leucine-rich repeat (LRR) protein